MGDNGPLIPFGPGAVVFVLAVAITAAVVVVFQGQGPTTTEFPQEPLPTAQQPVPPPAAVPSPSPSDLDPLPTSTIDITLPSDTASPGDAAATSTAGPTDPADLDIQVLIGTDDADQADGAVAVLEALGYTIIDREPSTRSFDETTVFYSEGHQADAEALRAADGRFGAVAPAVESLDAAIPLHIVVGTDWPAGEA